jgi:hypothetical protein
MNKIVQRALDLYEGRCYSDQFVSTISNPKCYGCMAGSLRCKPYCCGYRSFLNVVCSVKSIGFGRLVVEVG